jgi:hypothetical protein
LTPKEATSLFLVMFTVVCALPAAAAGVALIPSAIAQEEDDDEDENLANGTVSNVLDNVNTAGDKTNTNTQLSVPITDLDQTDANLGLSETLDATVERTLSSEEEPPEFVAFCLEITNPEEEVNSDILCFDTSEECAEAQEFLEDRGFVISMECEGVETFPPGARECLIIRDNQGEIAAVGCP